MTDFAVQVAEHESPLCKRNSLVVSVATTPEEIAECQRLRFSVFAEEMGAKLHTLTSGLDHDHFDHFARHLIVRDIVTGEIAATTRLLDSGHAGQAGTFYSETEFDIQSVLSRCGNLMEVGRTCVAEKYRSGAALTLMWRGIMRIAEINRIDCLIGCASIPMGQNGAYAHSIMDYLHKHDYVEKNLSITPRHGLPECHSVRITDVIIPVLLKGYLKMGAKVSSEACYDPDFNVADVFILLHCDSMARRYHRHLTH
jgi:putative hemolysin